MGTLNLNVSQLWDATESMEKTAATSESIGFFTRDRIRQECVMDRVLAPQFVTQNDIERNTDDDYPLIRAEKELDTKAFSVGFHGAARTNFFQGSKYEIYFGNLRTQEHNKTQEELMTMRMPVVDYFNRHAVFDLGAQGDRIWRRALDLGCQSSSQIIPSTATAFNKPDAVKAVKMMDRTRKPAGCWLMSEARWNDLYLMSPDDIGYTKVGDIAFGGVKKIPTFMDIPVVRTIEAASPQNVGGVWSDTSVYLLTTPEFLGKNFILTDVTYHMKREYNNLTWGAWMTRGAGIGSNAGIIRLDMPNAI